MHENDRNPCKEMACKGICCFNIRGQYRCNEGWLKLAFPDANNVHTMDNLIAYQLTKTPGVYYVTYGNNVQVLINGNCPNLNNEGLCKIHQEPFFPNMCFNMQPGSEECKHIRRVRYPKA